MSFGYNIPLVTALCNISPEAFSMSRSEQVEHLSFVTEADLSAARAFYARNYVTRGMAEFLRGALKRLSGHSHQAVFELRQAMGGGKTHNMIALGLLARFPELKELLPETITMGIASEAAKIATVNGRDVRNFIWGDIAEQLGKTESFRNHWANGPKAMNEGDWINLIGDEPTLIMLDELPPYLAVAHTQVVGRGTLLDLQKYSIANLFSAAMKCKRCVVVVASLDASYDEARRVLGGMLADLKNEISRGAQSITPVDLSTDEIYDILRKRLFTKLPDPHGPDVDKVVDAYQASYQEGIKGRALAKSAEQMADEIVGSYPFHPSYKDILSLFKENEKFRQTRGLIQFTANLIRGVWATKEEVFLIGAQYLDFSDQETRDQVREIERSLESALASDVYDTDRSSHAQEIDGERNDRAASQVATLLFISSLSDNTDGIRGLSRDTVVEYLVAPGKEPTCFIEAFEQLRERCWYLHNRDGDRWYFSDIANVRKQIEDKVGKIPQDRVDEEMRRRLTDIFRPVNKVAYSELAVLPRVDDVRLTSSKRTCLVLSPDAKSPPAAATRFFNDVVYKNAFCVVAGDGSKMASAEDNVRRLLAIEAVKTIVVDTPRHQREIETEQKTTEIGFNSTVKSLFNAVWYPQAKELKSVRIDLGHFQEKGAIQGEKAVEMVLAGAGARKLVEPDSGNIDGLIQRCEDQLFPDGQSRTRWSDVLERAASNPRWIWLPPKGMEEIKAAALADRRWVEENGYVDKNPPPPKPLLRVTRIGGDETIGESDLEIAVSNAGKVPEILIASTRDGLGTGETITEQIYRTKEVELWFQARNPITGEISEPYQWTGSIAITHERRDNAGTWQVTLTARPEAELRWNTSGINPKDGTVYGGSPIEIDGRQKTSLYVYAQKGSVSAQRTFTLDAVGAKKTIDDNRPAKAKRDFQFASKADVLRVVRASKGMENLLFHGVSVTVGEGERSLRVRSGGEVALTGQDIETMIDGLRSALGAADAEVQLRFREADFPDGFTMKDFATQVGIDISVDDVEQDD
ncbi:anti-phage-associated DUF499 domain-containing protein [Komagataeibacter europaeus]|uniref:anti-phage-associated DUF499 domain-containing protein n=1 Tax=Komagataeibacter europaeus TaxID=33995 RepID=UPI000237E48B|nr:anti-phage-associated DUF499 domain-containing protein [Komagataeibacter europaeus]